MSKRSTFVLRNGELVEKHGPLDIRLPVARSALGAPYAHTDGMEALVNHADNRMYDSKSAFRRATRAAGCREIGTTERQPIEKQYPDTKGIREGMKLGLRKQGF